MRWLAVVAAAALVGSCSAGEDLAAAKAEAAEFRADFNARRFDRIYADASPELRGNTAKPEFLEVVTALRGKLGEAGASSQSGFHVNYNNGVGYVTLNYKTEFKNGPGDETFVFRKNGAEMQVVSYNVDSKALLLN